MNRNGFRLGCGCLERRPKPTAVLSCLLAILLPLAQSCSVTLPVAGHFADKSPAKQSTPKPKSHKWLITGLVAGVAIDATIVILFINALGEGLSKAYSNHQPSCSEQPNQPDC